MNRLLLSPTRWLAAVAMAVLTACSTDSTGPRLTPDDASLAVSPAAAKGMSMATVKTVGRLGSLGSDVSARATIGAEGGELSLPALGFTLIVPPGAVDRPTNFAVTAIAGRSVAYEFQPHGLQFKVPLVFRQDARFTTFGWGQQPAGGYFADRGQVNGRTGQAQVSEQLPARLNGPFIEFLVRHFSGYLVSCA